MREFTDFQWKEIPVSISILDLVLEKITRASKKRFSALLHSWIEGTIFSAQFFTQDYETHGVLNTGAHHAKKFESKAAAAYPEVMFQGLQAQDIKVQVANGFPLEIRNHMLFWFFNAERKFEQYFFTLPAIGTVLIGLSHL